MKKIGLTIDEKGTNHLMMRDQIKSEFLCK